MDEEHNQNTQTPSDDTVTDVASTETEQQPETNAAVTLVSLERLILGYLAQLEGQEAEYKKIKEMLDNIFNNNPEYQELTEKAKEVSKEKGSIKRQIMQQPDAKELGDKIRVSKEELKEMKDNLSNYLQQYAQLAGTNQFEDDQGQVREIIYIAKLVKRSEKFRT
jgi:chemotaxis regulatin CheY-phosphate phosphatase CheZ